MRSWGMSATAPNKIRNGVLIASTLIQRLFTQRCPVVAIPKEVVSVRMMFHLRTVGSCFDNHKATVLRNVILGQWWQVDIAALSIDNGHHQARSTATPIGQGSCSRRSSDPDGLLFAVLKDAPTFFD